MAESSTFLAADADPFAAQAAERQALSVQKNLWQGGADDLTIDDHRRPQHHHFGKDSRRHNVTPMSESSTVLAADADPIDVQAAERQALSVQKNLWQGIADGLTIDDHRRPQHHHSGKDSSLLYPTSGPTAPILVHQTPVTQVYRHGPDSGIKVILPSATTSVAQLEHEHRVSSLLPRGARQRRTRRVDFRGDHPALYFEWTEGVPLDRWLREAALQNQREAAGVGKAGEDWFARRLRAALAVAGALSDLHGSCVAHGQLTPSHIVLDAMPRHCEATLIDLSRARHPADEQDLAQDLRGLGRVLGQLFRGCPHGDAAAPSASERSGNASIQDKILLSQVNRGGNSEGRNTKRGKQQDIADGLPPYLSSLVAALSNSCESKDETMGRYTDVKDVVADLRAALEKNAVYFRPLQESEVLRNCPGINKDAFYGRQSELAVLMHAYNSVVTLGRPVMAAVSGHGGMGKTTLANQIIKPLKARHGYLISGKFDDGRSPDLVIFSAINLFFGTLLEREAEEVKSRLRTRITDVVGEYGVDVLTKSIPNLGRLVGNDYVSVDLLAVSQQQLLHRCKYLVVKLIDAIADKTSPVVLLFDDLQWADATSLDLFQMIASHPDIRYCLCVGCYRDDDCVLAQKVTDVLDSIKNQVSVMAINLGNLGKESVNVMISEIFCIPPSLTTQLSSIVLFKTAGAPIYILNFLRTLCEEGQIHFALTARRWEYQIEGIRKKELPTGVVQYMRLQMLKLPHSQRLVLKVAACLGHRFDFRTFQRAQVKAKFHLENILHTLCTSFGFLQEIDDNYFAWAHDQVQQAGYGLIPPDKREAFHLLIGARMYVHTPRTELEKSIFDIAAQISLGKRLLKSDGQRCEAVKLILLAGEVALRTSAFHSAATYFMSAIDLLGDDCWSTCYKLSLKIYDAAVEALFATGDFATLSDLTLILLSNARNFDDKLNCYHNLVRYLASSGQSEEGLSTCIQVLEELGEQDGIYMGMGITVGLNMCSFLSDSLPTKLTDVIVYKHYKNMKSLLSKFSEEDILNFPQMVNERKLTAMEFLNHMVSSCNATRPHLCAVVVCLMVSMTLDYGLCDLSACAFSGFGNMNAIDQDFESGYRYGYIALRIMEKIGKRNRLIARVYTNVYGFINIWKNPFQSSLPKLLEGHHAGCLHGDIEYAFWQLQIFCGLMFNSGHDLTKLHQSASKYAREAMQHKQLTVANGIVTILSAVLELTGIASSKDGAYKTIFYCTEDVLYQQLASKNEARACVLICNKGKLVSIFKGEIDTAVKYYHMGLKYPFGSRMTAINLIMTTFTNGLLGFICALKGGNDRNQWKNVGLGALKQMKKWAKSSEWNFSNKVFLLEAESMLIRGNFEVAKSKYEASIKAAHTHRFVHEEGLAFERAGNFYLERGKKTDAILLLGKAKACYERWGAMALVHRLDSRICHLR